jgi:UDP-N-acetylglucosamine 2-epimerase (non-hydrolysing)
MKIYILVGTRPNFIKVTQFKREALQYPHMNVSIIHTGQHYDHKMADIFFEQFDLQPDYFLNIAPGEPVLQIAEIMNSLHSLCKKEGKPDLLLVPGDVNSTLAGALFAQKTGIKLGHIESGLRSYDREMPEEINRILTDEISDYYFVTENSGVENIEKEGLKGKVFFVGNTMIDTMVAFESEIQKSTILSDLNCEKSEFALMTIHRPSNVDNKEGLLTLLDLLKYLEDKLTVIFPIHPRTILRIEEFGLKDQFAELKNLIKVDPLSYFDFQKLVSECQFVLTDSGGIQEETTFRQKPCLTLRKNTERPITLTKGSNTLVSFKVEEIKEKINAILSGSYKKGIIPELWDGNASARILKAIDEQNFNK